MLFWRFKPHSWFLCFTRISSSFQFHSGERSEPRGAQRRDPRGARKSPVVTRALYASFLENMEAVRFRATLVNRPRWYTARVHDSLDTTAKLSRRECSSLVQAPGRRKRARRPPPTLLRTPIPQTTLFPPFINRVNPLSDEVSSHDKIYRVLVRVNWTICEEDPRKRENSLFSIRQKVTCVLFHFLLNIYIYNIYNFINIYI